MKAYVNGLSTIVKPGFSGLPSGAKVQVKLTLTDNGAARYADAVDIVVNEFVDGPVKPLIYDSGEQIIQQVAIHGATTSSLVVPVATMRTSWSRPAARARAVVATSSTRPSARRAGPSSSRPAAVRRTRPRSR